VVHIALQVMACTMVVASDSNVKGDLRLIERWRRRLSVECGFYPLAFHLISCVSCVVVLWCLCCLLLMHVANMTYMIMMWSKNLHYVASWMGHIQ